LAPLEPEDKAQARKKGRTFKDRIDEVGTSSRRGWEPRQNGISVVIQIFVARLKAVLRVEKPSSIVQS